MTTLTTRLINRLKCRIGYHDWRIGRLIPLNVTGPVYVCARCYKSVCYDQGERA